MFWREFVHSTCFSQSTYHFLKSLQDLQAMSINNVVNPGREVDRFAYVEVRKVEGNITDNKELFIR